MRDGRTVLLGAFAKRADGERAAPRSFVQPAPPVHAARGSRALAAQLLSVDGGLRVRARDAPDTPHGGIRMKPRNVYAIVQDEAAARDAVVTLRREGFDGGRISVLAREGERGPASLQPDAATGERLRAPEGIAVGAAVGGPLGWIATVGALTIPGVGAVVAAGPILTALGGAAVGAASGMAAGSFLGLGMSETAAREYQEAAVRGDVVLAVNVQSLDEQARAARILAEHEARSITTAPPAGETNAA